MKKKVFLLLGAAVVFNLAAKAQVYGDDEKDYIKYSSFVPQTIENGKIKPFMSGQEKFALSGIGDNWFVSVKGGMSVFNGAPLGCDDLFGRTKFTLTASLGKWHSRYFGTRVTFQGFSFDNADKQSMNYQNIHGDLMLNLGSAFRSTYTPLPRWDFITYLGAGVMHNSTIHTSPFSLSYGVIFGYRVSDRLHITAEVGGSSTYQKFDGLGKDKHFGDNLFQASVGLTYGIGKQGYERKKSLGVLNTGDLGNVTDLTRYPKNDYKGLNDLRNRLAGDSSGDGSGLDNLVQFEAPVFFFFKINTTNLVDKQQKVNIPEIAGDVLKYNLKVKVIGAADSKTGTPAYNRKLSIRRAKYIAKLLINAGVPKDRMIGASEGGINYYKPYTANRHTCVILYKEKE